MSTDDKNEIIAHLTKQDELLRKMSSAILGDEFGNQGLVKRTAALEARVDATERKMIYWSGAAAAVAVAASYLKSKIFNA